MNDKHRFEFDGRSVTLYKVSASPAWYVAFEVKGQRYVRALGKDAVQAEALAKSMISAACAGVPLPSARTSPVEAEQVVAHGQRALLRQNASGTWSARIRLAVPGRQALALQRDLGTEDLAQARVFAANLVLRLLTEAGQGTASAVQQPVRQVVNLSTEVVGSPVPPVLAAPTGGVLLGDLLDVYLQLAPVVGARGGVNATAAKRNCNCLRNVVAEGLGIEQEDALEQPLEVLTTANARAWKGAWVARYAKSHHGSEEDRRTAAIRSGCSVWRQGRSVFNRYMMAAYRDRGIVVPACVQEWLREPLWPSVRDEYRPADDATVKRTFEAARQLCTTDPHQRDVAVAFWLAVGAALRRGDIGRIRWDDIIQREGQWWVASDAQGKDHERIEVPLLDDAASALAAFREPGKPVLWHTVDRVARWVAAWMDELGWGSSKKLHELRAWSICQVGAQHGLESARMFARHKDPSLTVRKYGRYLKLQHLKVSLPR
jgi:integrase